MKYYKSLIMVVGLLLFATGLVGQETEEASSEKVSKKEEATMKAKTIEFQEPAYAMDIEMAAKANSGGIHNAYTIELMNADKKVVDKAWRRLMKSYKGKSKYNRKEAELATTNARLTELGSANYTVKSSIEQRGGNVILHSWYEGEEGYVDGSFGSEDDGVRRLLQTFAVDVRRDMVKQEVDKEEKELKLSENELSKLKRQHDGYLRDIEVAKRKIAEAEQKIIENEAEQEEAVLKIDGQRQIVEAVRQRLKRIN